MEAGGTPRTPPITPSLRARGESPGREAEPDQLPHSPQEKSDERNRPRLSSFLRAFNLFFGEASRRGSCAGAVRERREPGTLRRDGEHALSGSWTCFPPLDYPLP